MRNILKQLWIFINCWIGIDLRNVIRVCSIRSPKRYFELKRDLKELKRQAGKENLFPFGRLYPCYSDKEENAGSATGAYFWQDLFIAQKIFKNNPKTHIDIGSSIAGFVAHVSSYRPIEVLDIRPLNVNIPNVTFKQCNIMDRKNLLPEITDSISCLHALEHFGLGRYGDPICYDGYLIGFNNITYLLKPNGKFYFSVPLGEQRIEFHAHRVFSLSYLVKMVSESYIIDSFSYVDDKGDFYPETEITSNLLNNNCGCHFGCAIFELTKK